MKATGAAHYNILQNNGGTAHQVVMHVHFHIIPRFPQAGLGLVWNASRLDDSEARELKKRIQAALEAG
jgi:histidine triad (HIT) family protein